MWPSCLFLPFRDKKSRKVPYACELGNRKDPHDCGPNAVVYCASVETRRRAGPVKIPVLRVTAGRAVFLCSPHPGSRPHKGSFCIPNLIGLVHHKMLVNTHISLFSGDYMGLSSNCNHAQEHTSYARERDYPVKRRYRRHLYLKIFKHARRTPFVPPRRSDLEDGMHPLHAK